MSHTTYTVHRCDKCGLEQTAKNGEHPEKPLSTVTLEVSIPWALAERGWCGARKLVKGWCPDCLAKHGVIVQRIEPTESTPDPVQPEPTVTIADMLREMVRDVVREEMPQ